MWTEDQREPVKIAVARYQADAEYQPFAYGEVGLIKWSLLQPPGPGIKLVPSSGQAKAGETLRLTVKVGASVRAGNYPLLLDVRAGQLKTVYVASIKVD